jgi:hypothetical protein
VLTEKTEHQVFASHPAFWTAGHFAYIVFAAELFDQLVRLRRAIILLAGHHAVIVFTTAKSAARLTLLM